MQPDERQLAARIRSGDPEGFRMLYDLHAARLLGYLLRLTNNRTEAEDLVQEVFLAAYTGRAGFQGYGRVISWLLGIATRRWRDRTRYRVAAPASLDALEYNGAMECEAATGAGVEAAVLDTLTLTRALARLEPPFREALLLVRSQGMTYAEAAAILEEPVGTVKWRVSEATRQMQRILETVDGEFDEMQRQSRLDRLACGR
jgi:RNA polymerase sigma-70 factor (ECF subfamily)